MVTKPRVTVFLASALFLFRMGIADAADLENVEALVRRGVELRQEGHDVRALPLFQKAYGLARTPRTKDDDHCNGTQTCDGSGSCKKKSGELCGGAGECASGSCVDGHCCGKSTCGSCQACTGAAGTCVAVTNKEDDTCKKENYCDGTGTCVSRFTEFPVMATGLISAMTKGPDGNIWYLNYGSSKVGRMTLGGSAVEFSLTNKPYRITAGTDGKLWLTEGSSVGTMTTAGQFSEFLSNQFSAANGIISGPDQNIWLAENGRLGRMSTAGSVTDFPFANEFSSYGAYEITVGPDNNLWFTVNGMNQVGKCTIGGAATFFSIPAHPGAPPPTIVAIAPGSDGNIWFAESMAPAYNQIVRMTPAGQMTEFTIPTPDSGVSSLALGSDGNVWFTESNGRQIGRITPAGVVTEFQTSANPYVVISGPDNQIWVTLLWTTNKIARFLLP